MISAQTRERVLAVAEQMGYFPNRVSHALRTGRSDLLGVVVWDFPGSWDSLILEGVVSAAGKREYLSVLGFSWNKEECERRALEAMCGYKVDGLIIAPTLSPGNARLYERLRDTGVKFVFAGRPGPIPWDLVMTDQQGGGYQVARHLIEQGCKHLVYLRADDVFDSQCSETRQAGCARAIREAGLSELVTLTSAGSEDSPEGVRQALEEYLAAGGRLDGLLGADDVMALSALETLAQMGLTVPEDVAVAGFDDLPGAPASVPALTSVGQDFRQIGLRATELLMSRISGNASDPVEELIKPTLVARASTERGGPDAVRGWAEALEQREVTPIG